MEKTLTNTNSQDLISQARDLAGSFSGSFIPYIPVIGINNKKTEKEIEVDGNLTKVEVPAKEGFNITTKDEKSNQYVVSYYAKTLEAVMLRVRYSISSKNQINPRYYSYEFDHFSDIIKVFDENKKVLIENDYSNIKKRFSTGETNSLSKAMTSFDLRVIIYIDIDGLVYRLKLNNASRSNFFDYVKTFGSNDVFTAYKTKFNLKFNGEKSVKFWFVEFMRGETVDLSKEIPLQRELQKFFNAERVIKAKEDIIDEGDQGVSYVEEEIKPDEGINVSQIPF